MSFETGRELNGEEVKVLVDNFQGEGWLQFSPNNELMSPPPDEPADAGVKSPSIRLRDLLYALWAQQGSKGSFDAFYGAKMDALHQQVREMLDKENHE